MGTKIALIFGAQGYLEWSFLLPLHGKCDVICADGGILCARAANFSPDVYIGDCDSGGAPEDGISSVLLPVEKDLTDLQAAYEYARDAGYQKIIFTACTGGRQDHHISNLSLLERAHGDGVEATVVDPWNEICYLDGGKLLIDCKGFRYFSILPIDRKLKNVRITNAKYPLDVAEVCRGDSLTVSNEPVSGAATIEIGTGAAWIVFSERI